MIPRSSLSRSTIYGIWFYGRHETGPCFVDFLCRFGYDRSMQVGVTPEETAVLIRWKKRSDNHALVRMKTEAILHASEGVGIGIIAKMVERAERTAQEWPADWRATRMRSVLTGHAGNQNAAEPARAQKQELETILARPPLPDGRPRRVLGRPGDT